MPTYMLPRTDRPDLPGILSDEGHIRVHCMDEEPIRSPDSKWWRLLCDAENARACAFVCEHEKQPEIVTVSVGIDSRRIVVFWRLPGDLRLVRRLSGILESHGADLVPADD